MEAILIKKDEPSTKNQSIQRFCEPRKPKVRTSMDGRRQAPSNQYSTKKEKANDITVIIDPETKYIP